MHIAGQEAHYFSIGDSAIRNIEAALMAADVPWPARILDLACSHGRVLRALSARFPEAELTACDIDDGAVDYCSRTFGATGVQANGDLETLNLPDAFDLIWCASLLTHLDRRSWLGVLRFCARHLTSNGVFVFTTHGRYVADVMSNADLDFGYGLEPTSQARILRDFAAEGFGYCDYPGQSDYGISVSSPVWITSVLEWHTDLQICLANEMGIDNHHDVYACSAAHARVTGDIETYAEDIAGRLQKELRGAIEAPGHLLAGDAPLRAKIADWIDAQVTMENHPAGPRVRKIRVASVLRRLDKEC